MEAHVSSDSFPIQHEFSPSQFLAGGNYEFPILPDNMLWEPISLPYRSREPSVIAPETLKYPSAEEWDKIKPVFTKLYSRENRTLKEVKVMLEKNHDFIATERMYKARINAWGLCKNLKKADKASRVRKVRQTGQGDPLFLNGRPVQHRLVRYCKENKISPDGLEPTASPRRQDSTDLASDADSLAESAALWLPSVIPSPRQERRTSEAGQLISKRRSLLVQLSRYCNDNNITLEDLETVIPGKRPRGLGLPRDANSHAETAAFRLQSFFRSPSKPPRPIASTDGTRIEEIIIWNTATYLSSYFTSGPGARYFRKKPDVAARETLPVQALALIRNRDAWDGVVDPIQLYNHVTKAMGALRYGLNGSAVEAMNNACDVVEILLIQQAPTLLSFLIQILACQVRGNSKLEAHIRNFITDMAAKVLGSTHPLSIIVNSICKVSSVIDRCRVLRTVTDALVDSFKILEDPSPRAETRQCYLNGVTSLKLRKEAQDYLSLVFSPGWEGDDEQDAEQIYQTASLLQLRHNVVEAEIQYRKCLAWLKEVELDILANGEDSSWLGWRYLINDCLVKLVWGLERMERIEESKTMWWRSLEFAFAAYGQDSVYILVRAARFDDFLTRHGYVKESRTLRDWCPSLLYRTKLPPEHL